jgi:hypothetical protein
MSPRKLTVILEWNPDKGQVGVRGVWPKEDYSYQKPTTERGQRILVDVFEGVPLGVPIGISGLQSKPGVPRGPIEDNQAVVERSEDMTTDEFCLMVRNNEIVEAVEIIQTFLESEYPAEISGFIDRARTFVESNEHRERQEGSDIHLKTAADAFTAAENDELKYLHEVEKWARHYYEHGDGEQLAACFARYDHRKKS